VRVELKSRPVGGGPVKTRRKAVVGRKSHHQHESEVNEENAPGQFHVQSHARKKKNHQKTCSTELAIDQNQGQSLPNPQSQENAQNRQIKRKNHRRRQRKNDQEAHQ